MKWLKTGSMVALMAVASGCGLADPLPSSPRHERKVGFNNEASGADALKGSGSTVGDSVDAQGRAIRSKKGPNGGKDPFHAAGTGSKPEDDPDGDSSNWEKEEQERLAEQKKRDQEFQEEHERIQREYEEEQERIQREYEEEQARIQREWEERERVRIAEEQRHEEERRQREQERIRVAEQQRREEERRQREQERIRRIAEQQRREEERRQREQERIRRIAEQQRREEERRQREQERRDRELAEQLRREEEQRRLLEQQIEAQQRHENQLAQLRALEGNPGDNDPIEISRQLAEMLGTCYITGPGDELQYPNQVDKKNYKTTIVHVPVGFDSGIKFIHAIEDACREITGDKLNGELYNLRADMLEKVRQENALYNGGTLSFNGMHSVDRQTALNGFILRLGEGNNRYKKVAQGSVRFNNENGQDAGGLTKELFQVLSEQMKDAIFHYDEKYDRYGLKNTQFTTDEMFNYGMALGNLVAINSSGIPPVKLNFFLLDFLLGRQHPDTLAYNLALLWLRNPAVFFHSGLKVMQANPGNVRDLFGMVPDYFWTWQPGDENDPEEVNVDADSDGCNVMHYMQEMTRHHLNKEKNKLDALKDGFDSVAVGSLLNKVRTPCELDLLVSGPPVTLDDVLNAVDGATKGYGVSDQQITWLKEILREQNETDSNFHYKFLKFWTSSVGIPPQDNLGNNHKDRLKIVMAGDADQLPGSHTCFNTLDWRPYGSKHVAKAKIIQAVLEGGGFGNM
ncbi:MAG: hypothetical protein AAF320_02490 [Myxococcota bacterium]